MTHESFRSKSALLSVSLPTALVSLLCLLYLIYSPPAASAIHPCDEAWSLDLPASERGVTHEGVAAFSVEAAASRWLVVEAQRIDTVDHRAAERPEVRLFDHACRELQPHPTLPRLLGRAVHFVRQSGPIYIQLETDEPRAGFLIDAWLGSGRNELSFDPWSKTDDPDPVPQEPVDEWDELRSDVAKNDDPDPVPQEPVDEWDELWTGVAKNDDPDPVPQEPVDEWDDLTSGSECRTALTKNDDPDPVPQEPVDEWDELRTEDIERCRIDARSQAREIPGLGILASTRDGLELRSLCAWAGHPNLLGTLTCARPLRLADTGQVEVTSILFDRPEILAIELDRHSVLSVIGAERPSLLDSEGHGIPAEQEAIWEIPSGRYFLQAHPGGSQFSVSIRAGSRRH